MTVRPINKYDGEFRLKVYGIEYPMRLNAKVYCQFKSETGRDLNSVFADVLNELNRLTSIGALHNDDAEVAASEVMAGLASIVDMDYAAWLFYLAAKEKDNTVTFEEMQEAVLCEGISQNRTCVNDGQIVQTYPQIFLTFTTNALTIGGDDPKKCKKSSAPSLLNRLKSVFST